MIRRKCIIGKREREGERENNYRSGLSGSDLSNWTVSLHKETFSRKISVTDWSCENFVGHHDQELQKNKIEKRMMRRLNLFIVHMT